MTIRLLEDSEDRSRLFRLCREVRLEAEDWAGRAASRSREAGRLVLQVYYEAHSWLVSADFAHSLEALSSRLLFPGVPAVLAGADQYAL